jgi:hypothetical protein
MGGAIPHLPHMPSLEQLDLCPIQLDGNWGLHRVATLQKSNSDRLETVL